MKLFALICLLAFAAVTVPRSQAQDAGDKPHRYVNIPQHFADLPFSDAVLADDTLYVSGRIGLDLKTRKVPDNLDDEVRMLMDSIKSVVEQAGMTMDDVVNVTIYCPDLTLYDRFNAVYRTYFKAGHYPARAFIGSGPLLFGGHFEMTTIAIRQPKTSPQAAKPAGKRK
ncbi:MAG: RidA family protein [Candidatus Koribacter versatilis]|uniref:RidA family protein n=1 Tax=Candidatus Korobacter versatilis TaxID=658062 RepID=A0A932A8R1_9BACT|nr:RidA family protein [Candidatus Koribacter versatilis]